MAKNYWITFRIEENGSAASRRDALYEAVQSLTPDGKWWVEPTSFILFSSEEEIGSVADTVRAVIDESQDIVLIGMPDFKSARIIGAWTDQDLTKFLPFVRNA